MRRSLATLLAAAALLADGAVAARYVSDDLADSLDEYSQAWADAIEAAYERRVKPDDRRDPAASASSYSYSFTTTRKPATTKPTVKPPPAPATKAPLVEPPVAPMIPAEALSADTVAPATVKPADDDSDDEHTVAPAPAATAPHDEDGDMATPASTTTSPSLTVENDDDSDSGKGGCPKYNEISSACGSVCPNNALCIKYRAGGECTSTNISTCVRPKADGCAYECLEGTSVDFDQWYISPYGVPAWNTILHNNQQIEAMRSVDVPRNITQLSLQFVFNELDGMNVKGKVATLEFPDKRIVSNSSTLSSIAIVNLDYRKLPPAALTPQLQYLVLENCLLTSVPDAVLGLKQLNFLNLASNTIQKLPSNLAQLPLTALYMDSNEVTEFPAFVAQMSSLKVVSFVGNNLTKFTTESRTSAMTELALDYNQLTDFAGNIPSLHNLFLRGNRLTGFPSTLASLTNLEVLDLTENALSSQAIDEAANKLTHPYLRELMLGSNGLHKVPDLGNVFPVLKTLWVRNNSIEKVEGTYSGKLEVLNAFSNKIKSFKASFSRLNVLDLTDNKLESLPDVASISSVLLSLNVSKNDLETLSDSKPLTTLTAFNASTNSLSSFSLTIPGLRSLDLSNNKLKSIPDAVWTYNVLDELHLDGNPKLENVELSRDQHSFLKRLSVFTMDASAMRHDCPEDWKTDLKGVTICVTNGAEDKVVLKSSGSDSQPWTWVSIALGAVAAVALVAFLFVVRRRRRQYEGGDYKHDEFGITTLKKEENTAGLTQTMGFSSLVRSYPNGGIWDDEELQDRRVDYDSIKLESRLASGAYGEVWIGTYRLECVAVKKLSDAGMRDKNAVSYFVSEIKLLAQLDHPRIIRFYGVAWTCLTDLCAVIEYMPGGDLHSLLRSHLLPSNRWNATKLQIALDTVEALTYVHTLDDVLIHRDLKSRNVLLDDDWRAKVTDFGISRFQRESDATMTSGVGTGRWMAPEVIMGRADYNEKVDIYSFGVILSELDTHQMPYENSTDKQLPLSEMGILQQVAAGELRPSFSRTCPPSIMEIAQKCLAFRPEDRPSSLELAYQLRQLIPMFPREEAARPSSVFSRGTFSMTTNPFRKSAAANTNWRPGSEIMLRSSGQSGEFSL